MAKFANPEKTAFKDWPFEKREAFREYIKSGGVYFRVRGLEDWRETHLDPDLAPLSAYTDDPKATHTHGTPQGVANPDRVPLGEMSEADRVAVATAWARGEQLWMWNEGSWYPVFKQVCIQGRCIYTTIDPTPKPEVEIDYPWEILEDWVEFVAQDEDGRIWGFNEEPGEGPGLWLNHGDECERLPIKVDTKGLNWTKTLRKRPADARGPI